MFCFHYAVTHVRNKENNIQGRSPYFVKVTFHIIRDGTAFKGKKFAPSGSKFFPLREVPISKWDDVASDVGVNLCNVKSCLNTSSNEIFTVKRGDLPCVNISKDTSPVVK